MDLRTGKVLVLSKLIKRGRSDESLWAEAEWGTVQPDLIEDVLAHCSALRLDDL